MTKITTAAELDALHMAVSVSARAACVEDRYSTAWLIVENDNGDLIAWSWPAEDEPDVHNWKYAQALDLPLTVLYRPDAPTPAPAAPATGWPTEEQVTKVAQQAIYDAARAEGVWPPALSNAWKAVDGGSLARAVLALFEAAVPGVKAEALREAADGFGMAQLAGLFVGTDHYPKAWLRARADRIERGARP